MIHQLIFSRRVLGLSILFLGALFFLASCATDYVPETTEGMFPDPNTKRIEQQEAMSRVTRELTIF